LIDLAGGWFLNKATSISDSGWIAGAGLFDPDGPGGNAAQPRMFLMHAPETAVPVPTGLALFTIAAPALLRRRRQRPDKSRGDMHRTAFASPMFGTARRAGSSVGICGGLTMRSNYLTLLAVLVGNSAATPAVAASLTALGALPGYTFSTAIGVSGDGSTVAGESATATISEAFRWTAGSGMQALGDLPGGAFKGQALGANRDGLVIVGESNTASGQEAFRWTSSGGLVGLGDLPGGGFGSVALGVSGDGAVVVGLGNSESGLQAFRWTNSGEMVGLGHLPGGGGRSIARSVSDDGSVVVGVSDSASASVQEAFRWTSGGGMVGLGDLPGGTFESVAYDVSDDGSVVVGFGQSASGQEAFRWTAATGMVGLGAVAGGIFSSGATAVSGDGAVVVGYGGRGAFYWTSAGGMQRLWDVLRAHGVDPGASGWTYLDVAWDVSANGKTIVGQGLHNGTGVAFVAVVPEPSTFGLFAVGVLAMARRCRAPRSLAYWTIQKVTIQ
jgi:probable HAF family extracellular repeat protein